MLQERSRLTEISTYPAVGVELGIVRYRSHLNYVVRAYRSFIYEFLNLLGKTFFFRYHGLLTILAMVPGIELIYSEYIYREVFVCCDKNASVLEYDVTLI